MKPTDLDSLTFGEIQRWFEDQGERAFRGRQVFQWIHRRAVRDFAEMTDLSKPLREKLVGIAAIAPVEIAAEQEAPDGTLKFRFRLGDGRAVEGVWMPEQGRRTLCVSTQVGCAMGCCFCATATLGLVRNLTAGEIVGQVEAVVRRLRTEDEPRPLTNIVYMGMGEPLANLDAVLASLEILLDDQGLGFSRRHITVSTAGLVPAMQRFAREAGVKLAVSLNATTDELRSALMPINKRFPLAKLLSACRELEIPERERITFEYVLIKDQNDSDTDARRLVRLLEGIRAKVNVIPINPFPGLPYERPSLERAQAFCDLLASHSLAAFVRHSRGESLRAACGQLVAADPTE